MHAQGGIPLATERALYPRRYALTAVYAAVGIYYHFRFTVEGKACVLYL
jgi:hypothetical protein